MRARSFAQRILLHLRAAAEHTLTAENTAFTRGLLQHLDARSKVAGLLALIVTGVWSRSVWTLLALLTVVAILAKLSHLHLRSFGTVAGALVLTLLIAVPAVFVTPGDPWIRLPLLGSVTFQGVRTAVLLILRVALAASASGLLVLTTPWAHVLKALRIFRVPVVAIVILSMTYRYILVLLRLASDIFEARESRRVGTLSPSEGRLLIASGTGVLLSKALSLSEDVYLAMRSRGFMGEVYILSDLQMRGPDWLFLALMLALSAAIVSVA